MIALLLVMLAALATPSHSVRAGSACDTCHVEPVGWFNPARKVDRACSLDCSGCHVIPTGGGLRTSAGRYFQNETLGAAGSRPSAAHVPRVVASDVPTEGRYGLRDGFSGWWPGDEIASSIPDRYGSIEARPRAQFGADFRVLAYLPTDGRDPAVFPMQASLYGAYAFHPAHRLVTSVGLASARDALDLLPDDVSATRQAIRYLAIPEAFWQVAGPSANAWLRAGRFAPAYGWRIPDHTSFVRRDLGFDQDRGGFGVEIGAAPNDLTGAASVFVQGLEAWPGDSGDRGVGGAVLSGVRRLGGQLGGSLHGLVRPEGPAEGTAGLWWGINLHPFVALGQVDVRSRGGLALFALHEVDLVGPAGTSARFKYDWTDPDPTVAGDHLHRGTLGVTLRPIAALEVEAQLRHSVVGGAAGAFGATPAGTEALVLGHAAL